MPSRSLAGVDGVFDVAMSEMCAIFPMDYVHAVHHGQLRIEGVYCPKIHGVQLRLENFGIHLHSNGEVIFGVKVESVMNNVRDNIPIDLIARIVFDLRGLCQHAELHIELAPASTHGQSEGTQYVNEVRDENRAAPASNRLDIGASRNRKRGAHRKQRPRQRDR